jgi:hypothetical protein
MNLIFDDQVLLGILSQRAEEEWHYTWNMVASVLQY